MRLPAKWNDLDWRIYIARIDQGQTWRQVAITTGKSHEYCRERLLQRLAGLPHVEVDAYRAQELARLDRRDERLTGLIDRAMTGEQLLDAQGEKVFTEDGTPIMAGTDHDAATKSIKLLNDVTKLRAALLGINRPIEVDVTHSTGDTTREVDTILGAYLAGINDSTDARSS